jgi:3-isopropylmalate dehydrogenase
MAGKNEIRLAVLEGDGIGPEITDATVKVLQAAARRTNLNVSIKKAPIGWQAYKKVRATLTDMTLATLRAHEGWIVGPTFAGEYPKDDPYNRHPNGYIRRNFGLFANVRPVQAWPQLDPLVPDIDITVLRENTEGFYPDRNMAWGYGEFKPRADVGLSLRVITGEACDRFAKFCLDYTTALGEKRLAIVHKRTALPQTEGLFIEAFEKIRNHYKGVTLELFASTLSARRFRVSRCATGSLPRPISLAIFFRTKPPDWPAASGWRLH